VSKKESFSDWPINGHDKKENLLDWCCDWLRYWLYAFILDIILRRQMAEKILHRHVFCFDPENTGGTALLLTTEFIDNKDTIIVNQNLSLHSYCNSASFNLCGTLLTPENLRKLANELESAKIHAQASHKKE
jgi:hypothetical protein